MWRPRALAVVVLLSAATHAHASGERARRRRRFGRWAARPTQSSVLAAACDDSCASARNGVCEDGSDLVRQADSRTVHELKCDYGTDCADCSRGGSRGASRPPPMASLQAMMPSADPELLRASGASGGGGAERAPAAAVALLRQRGVHVNAAWTRTQPSFIMPFTDPNADIDVSRAMQSMRSVEPLYNLYWHRLCAKCCANGGLMLDVGANFGYYSLLAAKLGCRVVAWEPVPVFRAFVEAAAALNNLTSRIHLRAAVVSDVAGQHVNMTVPLKGIWGTASVGGLNVDPSIRSPTYTVTAPTETLDQVVRERPCIMKLDVEGYEPSVVRGATQRFLRDFAPAAILTEYTPGVMERFHQWQRLPEYPQSLRAFSRAGYRIWHLFGTSKGSSQVLEESWATATLPRLAEVTERTLRAEETNARNMETDNRGQGAVAAAGFAVPWDLHPQSLHAEFSHNTDLLLTRTPEHHTVQPSREVGITAETPFGLGGGMCAHVLRDGTAAEMLGRLCLQDGTARNESIQRAIAAAELPRPIRHRQTWHSQVAREARQWKLTGRMRSAKRQMVRLGEPSGGGGGWGLKWGKGRGAKGKGRGITVGGYSKAIGTFRRLLERPP